MNELLKKIQSKQRIRKKFHQKDSSETNG